MDLHLKLLQGGESHIVLYSSWKIDEKARGHIIIFQHKKVMSAIKGCLILMMQWIIGTVGLVDPASLIDPTKVWSKTVDPVIFCQLQCKCGFSALFP